MTVGILKNVSTLATGLGLVLAASTASAAPLRAGDSLPTASAGDLRVGQASAPGTSSALFKRRGGRGPGTLVFVIGGIVLIGLVIIIASGSKSNSPG